MGNKSQQKTTFPLISDHRLIGFNCNLKLDGTINHPGQSSSPVPAKEASWLPSERDVYSEPCQGPGFLEQRSCVDLEEVQILDHKK